MKNALISSLFILLASSAAADTEWTGFYAGLQCVNPDGEVVNNGTVAVDFDDTIGVF